MILVKESSLCPGHQELQHFSSSTQLGEAERVHFLVSLPASEMHETMQGSIIEPLYSQDRE